MKKLHGKKAEQGINRILFPSKIEGRASFIWGLSCLNPRALYPHTVPGGDQTHAYLSLHPVEFSRFNQTELARLCSTSPHLAVDGRYPLRCLAVSGFSSSVSASDTLPYSAQTSIVETAHLDNGGLQA